MAANNMLLVEGKDDEHVFYALLQHHQVPDVFRIKAATGIEGAFDRLLETLEVAMIGSDLERLAIVVDADTSLSARWSRLKGVLSAAGYADVPEAPAPDGTVLTQSGAPRLGVWIMPDNSASGMIEDFVGFLVPPGDSLWTRAEDCLDTFEPEWRFPAAHFSKARLHTWLAWQKEPGRPMGTSITARYLDADAPHAHAFIRWITRVFVE